jgi:hypothetical protein
MHASPQQLESVLLRHFVDAYASLVIVADTEPARKSGIVRFLEWQNMTRHLRIHIAILLGIMFTAIEVHAVDIYQPRTFGIELRHLEMSRQAILNGDPQTRQNLRTTIQRANAALLKGPFSVTFTPHVAPSGDPHDLHSFGPYAWPNPDTPDGLPWVLRDGITNPDADLEWDQLFELGNVTESMMLAHYFTGDEQYAERTALLMRTWFVDPATRMNPRDEYSAIVPGVRYGSFAAPGWGNLLGGRYFMDSLGLLEASEHWTEEDRAATRQWFSDFRQWALESPIAHIQQRDRGNHGTNYDYVMAQIGLYLDDHDFAKANADHYFNNRFLRQYTPDGHDVVSMTRANNLLYHRYNLNRALDVAVAGNRASDNNYFEYETSDERSLRAALDFLLPYWSGEQTWEFWPGAPFPREPLVYYSILRRSAIHFKDPRLLDMADQIRPISVRYEDLIYPREAVYEQVWRGDSNADGLFNSQDLIQVLAAGKYETGEKAFWADGDWNQDGLFN